MAADGALVVRGGRVEPPGRGAPDPALEVIAAALEEGGLRPPTEHQLGELSGLPVARVRQALGALRQEGRAVPADALWFAPAPLDEAREAARAALAERPMGIAELRDLWGVGRKHALAIAAHLDASGLTVRRGDERVLRRAERAG
jgi:selenocysteine-specific elongation factor